MWYRIPISWLVKFNTSVLTFKVKTKSLFIELTTRNGNESDL